MAREVELTDDQKLELLAAALEAEDLRPVLRESCVGKRSLAELAHKANEDGIITADEYSKIKSSIERSAVFPTDIESRIEAVLSSLGNTETKQALVLCLREQVQTVDQITERFKEITGGFGEPGALQAI